ncbi:phosphate/phosphite/phosphonate ABC transporter substrate-binding protein [Vibrio sp. SCSIO 43132]|uniref:phosphate/phosphite/phosphonate ABC transporter substrate-binding protein n=1 Tax=Vibrio sp. SCSIO 43132 TaxID=2779363 RepID=UPI001CA8E716|nr:phosphate/phosphite/phosphonate ABC transporter substrate-binding protein [Vibrio sp. SCSIO 43132]UAB74073.1 phosphate/phosphite/phosphonate ABC transporter substrate-binding protein [Vibrio sp. SCSIO 43132]
MYRIQPLLLLVLTLFSTSSWSDEITFGVVPQQSAKKLAAKWGPIFLYISKKTGHNIHFATAKDIPTFEKRLLNGEYDLAYMNPYHYTVFSQKPGYQAFAKQTDKKIKGIVVVPKDSELKDLAELSGSTLAFPSPAAFAASVLPRAKMQQEGISFSPQYVSSHDSVYLAVSKGIFPAGGGVMRTFNNTSPEVRSSLKVMWSTPGYTPHAFAALSTLDPQIVSSISNALQEMIADEEGKKLLKSINFKGVSPAEDSDWDDVRSLEISLLNSLLD